MIWPQNFQNDTATWAVGQMSQISDVGNWPDDCMRYSDVANWPDELDTAMWPIGQISWMQRYEELHWLDEIRKTQRYGELGSLVQLNTMTWGIGQMCKTAMWRIGYANELSYTDMGDMGDIGQMRKIQRCGELTGVLLHKKVDIMSALRFYCNSWL